MLYLYGDSTPFPLDDNFVDTLSALTDACVALLRIDEELERLSVRADSTRTAAGQEIARLETIASSVVRTMDPHIAQAASPASGQVAVRVVQAARGVLEAARTEAAARRDAAVRELATAQATARATIPRALEAFLVRHDIPHGRTAVLWQAGAGTSESPAEARCTLSAPFKLSAELDLAIPAGHAFAQAVRVADLARDVIIRLPVSGGWLRKGTRMKRTALDRWFVTRVEHDPAGRIAYSLRKSVRGPSPGLEIVLRGPGQERPTVRQLSESGPALSDPVVLAGPDHDNAQRVWKKLEAGLAGLELRRTRLGNAVFEGRPITEVPRPAVLAERIINAAAPLVRELRLRSAAPGELDLKRDLGGGRREEMYVSTEELTRKFTNLSASRRKLFDAFGLGEDLVLEALMQEEVGHDTLVIVSSDEVLDHQQLARKSA